MKKQRPKYPASLFWSGVALNIVRSFLWLVVSTILLILGNKTPWCGIAGLALLVLVVAIAIVKQLSYRQENLPLASWSSHFFFSPIRMFFASINTTCCFCLHCLQVTLLGSTGSGIFFRRDGVR